MPIKLEKGNQQDQKCPHCQTNFNIEDWDTEGNNPQIGYHVVKCSECYKPFTIGVWVTVSVYSKDALYGI